MPDFLANMLSGLDGKAILEDVLGKIGTILVGVAVAWVVFFSQLRRFWVGDSDDLLVQAHYLLPRGEKYLLVFRTVVSPTTVKKLFDNDAAQRLIRRLAKATTIDQPILQSDGHLGFEIVNDILNHISGHLAVSPLPRSEWLMVTTCEDRRVAKKKCIRVFLIRPEDLTRFRDERFMQEKVTVESPWHFFRIVALHRIANDPEWLESMTSNQASKSTRDQFLVEPRAVHPRIRRVSLGLPETESSTKDPIEPNWSEATKYLRSFGSKIALARNTI
jgi:hypothetical protein